MKGRGRIKLVASDETAKSRMAICNSCEHFRKGICGKCNCVMRLKTKIQHVSCPIGKW